MLWFSLAQAQAVPPKTKPATPAKTTTKPAPPTIMPDTIQVPNFVVRFGPYNGASPAPTDDIKRAVSGELTIMDQRGQKWTPVAWRFIWNRKEVNDDWKTGKRKTMMTYNIVEIDSSNKLPESWQNELRDFIQPGEEIIFERIIIEHPGSKRRMAAKDLMIKII
jgi:hypothetical protein